MNKNTTYKLINLYNEPERKENVLTSEYVGVFSPYIEFNEDEIVLIDSELNIKYVNKSFAGQFLSGKKKDEKIKNLNELFSLDPIEKIVFAIATMRNSEINTYKFGFSFEDNDNNEISYCVRIFKSSNINGETLFILVLHNKTQEKRLIKKYLYAKQEAESSQKAKEVFLSQMSHEIRTPLNKILSYTDLLKMELEHKLSDETKDAFKVIGKASDRLVRTFDLLITLSEIQANAYKCNFREIDLIENIIEPTINEYKKLAEEKGLTIEKDFETDKVTVRADFYSLTKIFGQILDNAIKYTPKGGVTIALRKDEKENMIILQVIDTGIGIAEKYLPKIFDPFSQEESGYTRTYEGNGIGLTIVKKFCELNNIDISITSNKGAGTTVTLKFKARKKYLVML